MPADYYADAGPEPEAAGPAEGTEKESATDSNVATLPKQVLGGKEFKPGEEVVLRVVQVMEDSVLVEYASDDHKEEKEPAPEAAPAPAPAPGGGGMSALME